MMNKNPLLMTDGYKTSHHRMYPEGTTLVYSNFTPRSVSYMPAHAKSIVAFGMQYVVKYIDKLWTENFFKARKEEVIGEAKEYLDSYLGTDYDVSHFEKLHDLGYLPLKIKAIKEGTILEEKIPVLTIHNTHPDFFWLPNFLETLISALLWKPMHSASLALGFKKVFHSAALSTDKENLWAVDFQGHDFSFRGMQHSESAITSGMGWLTSFKGTDTIPALQACNEYYQSKHVGFSVPASEHAVITAYGKENEIEGFKRLMEQYPTGILSVVSDSFDLWKVCTEFLPTLKDQIIARDGKLVIRPDSGNPVDIICGIDISSVEGAEEYEMVNNPQPYHKGVVELLWDVFGGTVNGQGYKVLDPHIGVIYGDSITLERAIEINRRLEQKGFASTNWVAGIGSYSLGYATRDSQGSAIKATYCEVDETPRNIFKDPITDDGVKKSAKGLLSVHKDEDTGEIYLKDECSPEEENTGLLDIIYLEGVQMNTTTIEEVRDFIQLQIAVR